MEIERLGEILGQIDLSLSERTRRQPVSNSALAFFQIIPYK